MHKINKELAELFSDMAGFYRFKGSEHRFRVTAYEKAARFIDNMSEDIRDYMKEGELVDLPGIGESIAEKIHEYVDSGKIKKHDELKKEIPPDFLDLLNVQGLGPETLKTLNDKLGISSREELVEALKDGTVETLDGFGKKKVQNILEGLEEQERGDRRIFLAEAMDIAEWVMGKMEACDPIIQVEVAGSLRRGRETIGDIDLLVSAEKKDREEVATFFTSINGIKKVLARGKTKASILTDMDHRQADLRIVDEDQWGAALLYFTGSKEHNIHLRKIAKERGLKINEYGLYETSGKKRRIAGKTEEEIYKELGLAWIPPELRENRGEIERAAQNKLPELIEFNDIRGDFHVHSDWSDGIQTIKEMARYAREQMEYSYMVLTDHSQSSRIAGGLDEQRFLEQFKAIDKLNKDLGKSFIKKGVEVDILPDGRLDLDAGLLEQMEWVVASIHSQFSRDNTDRILAACKSPFVNAIGHPSGRLIGKRKPYPLDIEKIIEQAAETGTALEINAQPQRMDIHSKWVKKAIDEGVMIVIGTDAHDLKNFDYMNQGVATARRGWCTIENVVNTRKWDDVVKFVMKKRDALGVKTTA